MYCILPRWDDICVGLNGRNNSIMGFTDVYGSRQTTSRTSGVRSAALAFSPNATLPVIASGSWDQTIRLWDPKTGAAIGEPLRGHTDGVNSLAFLPDGSQLVSGSEDRVFGCGIRLWVPRSVNHCDTPIMSHASRFLAMGSLLHRVQMTTQSGYGMLHLAQRSEHRSKDTAMHSVCCFLPR